MIELVTTWDALVDVLGAAAMVAFGAWVLTLTPRTRETKMLALFAIAAGSVWVQENLFRWSGWELYALRFPYEVVVLTVATLALLGLAHALLERAGGPDRRLWHGALGITTGLVLVPLAFEALLGFPQSTLVSNLETWERAATISAALARGLFFAGLLALLFVLVRRYRHPPSGREDEVRSQSVLMSMALVLWPAFQAGALATVLVDPTEPLGYNKLASGLLFGGFLVLAGLWLLNAHAVPDRSNEGRRVALLTLATLLLAIVDQVFLSPLYPDDGAIWGMVRLLTVVGLGYAILRHEILGIEAKFRWGVSKTTVAGIFVAVFFVVSEGAQALFADFAGNEFLGVLAAGALVFAISPLQRLADRFAAKAVPGGVEAGAEAAQDAEERYSQAVRVALGDGKLSRGEEHELADLADDLGISTSRALELREQVEDERDAGGEAA